MLARLAQLSQGLCFAGLSILIVATPWAFGGVTSVSQKWFYLVACCTLLPACVLHIFHRRKADAGRISLVGYVLALAMMAGALQIVPLSTGILEAISPHAIAARRTSAAAAGEALPEQLPISLYASSTSDDLALLALVFAAFLLAHSVIRSRGAQIGLLAVVATNGAVFAIFGLVQQLTFNGMLYWSIPLRFGGKPFAAFVNRNHAGGYLNMCVAAALALVVFALTRRQTHYGAGPDDYSQPFARGGSLGGGISGLFANLDSMGLLAIAGAVCATIGSICSISRGAILALACAATLTAFAAVRARGAVSLAAGAVLVLVVSIGMALWLGQSEVMGQRWGETVSDLKSNSNSRVDHWQDVTAVCRDYWKSGTGLGTYRYIYRPYESQLYNGWFFHAENQYLESLVEMGWLGLLFILTAIYCVFRSAIRLLYRRGDSLAFGVGLAAFFMICSQTIHACFDFGLYMPANAILCAVISGLALASIPSVDRSETRWLVQPSRIRQAVESLLFLVTAALIVWGTLHTFNKARIETAFEFARDLDPGTPCEDLAKIDESITRFHDAIERMPDNAEARYRLAELHVLRYRLKAAEQLRNAIGEDDDVIWQFTSPLALHRRCHELKKRSTASLAELRQQPLIQQDLVPAVQNLLAARRSCPLMSKVHFGLAELFIALPERDALRLDEVNLVQTAVQLAPNDPDVLFRAGLLDWQAGRDANARAEWRKSLTLSSLHAKRIFDFVANQEDGASRIIAEIAPDDPARIVDVARQLDDARYKTLLAERAEETLPLAPTTRGLRNHLLGGIYELKGRLADAIDFYEQAVGENPENLAWRLQLAKFLLTQGRLEEAADHAAECVRRAPNERRYRELVSRIRKAIQSKSVKNDAQDDRKRPKNPETRPSER